MSISQHLNEKKNNKNQEIEEEENGLLLHIPLQLINYIENNTRQVMKRYGILSTFTDNNLLLKYLLLKYELQKFYK